MIKVPTSRKRKRPEEKLNLVPIMDSVFIFIFFLLTSASFMKIYEIGSDVPILSEADPPKNEKEPLAITLKLDANELSLFQGVPSKLLQRFPREENGDFNYEQLHIALLQIKKNNLDEDTIIFEPTGDLTYEEIVKVMDAVRMINKTDETIFKKNKDGIEEKVKNLFDKIVFSNLMS